MNTPASKSFAHKTCPCGSKDLYPACCGRYHDGIAAPDALSLMRSRYSAYVIGIVEYLLQTWHPSSRPATLALQTQPRPHWLGLSIKRHEVEDESHAVVEFIARYRLHGRATVLHEISRFVREDGRWFYVDGNFPK